jgi:hypothetical protein
MPTNIKLPEIMRALVDNELNPELLRQIVLTLADEHPEQLRRYALNALDADDALHTYTRKPEPLPAPRYVYVVRDGDASEPGQIMRIFTDQNMAETFLANNAHIAAYLNMFMITTEI